MPAIQPFAVGFDAYHLNIPREQNPWSGAGTAYAKCAQDYYDGWDTALQREEELADQKHDAQQEDDLQDCQEGLTGGNA